MPTARRFILHASICRRDKTGAERLANVAAVAAADGVTRAMTRATLLTRIPDILAVPKPAMPPLWIEELTLAAGNRKIKACRRDGRSGS